MVVVGVRTNRFAQQGASLTVGRRSRPADVKRGCNGDPGISHRCSFATAGALFGEALRRISSLGESVHDWRCGAGVPSRGDARV